MGYAKFSCYVYESFRFNHAFTIACFCVSGSKSVALSTEKRNVIGIIVDSGSSIPLKTMEFKYHQGQIIKGFGETGKRRITRTH